MSKIHPSALVSKKAKIASDVEIGPYCIIGDRVTIGRGTRLLNHVTLEGVTVIGENNQIYTGTCIGFGGQMRNPKPGDIFVTIGDGNIFREYVTVHGSSDENHPTRIENRGFFMANSHIAHDCVVEDDVTMANVAALGGHVHVESFAMIGGLVGVHQNVRIGKYSMLGGLSKPVLDVPPFSICSGAPAKIFGVNAIGLKRGGYASKDVQTLKKALNTLLGSGLTLSEAMTETRRLFPGNKDVEHLLTFAKNSQRGLLRFKRDIEVEVE